MVQDLVDQVFAVVGDAFVVAEDSFELVIILNLTLNFVIFQVVIFRDMETCFLCTMNHMNMSQLDLCMYSTRFRLIQFVIL